MSGRADGGQVVVLTGAGGRFGRILAERLIAEAGLYPVLLTSDPNRLAYAEGQDCAVHQVTLSDPRSISAVFGRIHDALGDIDVLINNAAVITEPGFRDFVRNADDARVAETYAVNCAGALACIKYTLNRGRDRGKKVVNLLAGRALTGHERHVDYYSSKAGLYNATKTLAHDYPRHAFRAVMSGRIDLGEPGDRGDSPDSMWAWLRAFIHEPAPAPFREVYFKGRLELLRHLLRYYAGHVRACERWPVERR